ncbi:MAG: putative DNA binding domain-containing protein [bacterium]
MQSFDLEELLAAETDRVEWKRSDRDGSAILQAVCALANDLSGTEQPGYLLLGVDASGVVCGLGYEGTIERDKAQTTLLDRLSTTNLLPHPSISIHPVERDGVWILVVEVRPFPVPPVVQVAGRTWVRPGPQTRTASPADEARLRERQTPDRRFFDQRPIPDATIDDLELSRLRPRHESERSGDDDPETFPGLEDWLIQQELAVRVDGVVRPNSTGLLVYGVAPQAWFPGAVVELVRYAGQDVDAPIVARQQATGAIVDQLETAWAFLARHIEEYPQPAEGLIEAFRPEYPREALEELLRNLLQHRSYEAARAPGRVEWYSDRIVFINPGGPFGQAALGNFGDHTDYRNPTSTRHLVQLGYVQRLGRGVRRVNRMLARNGQHPVEVQTDGYTCLTVWKAQ